MTDIVKQAPGVYALLEQDKYWIDKEGTVHAIDDMSDRYVVNVIAFLQRRAQYLEIRYSMGEVMHPIFGDAPDEVMHDMDNVWRERLNDPEGWLDSTPLMRKLLSRPLGQAS